MKHLLAFGTLLALVIALHFAGNAQGIYDAQIAAGFVWYDNLLHALVGVACAILWLGILAHKKPGSSFRFRFVSAVIFAFVLGLGWEIFELLVYWFFTSQAIAFKIYSPSLSEALADTLSNALGGCIVGLAAKTRG